MTKPGVKWAVDKKVYPRILLVDFNAAAVSFLNISVAISDRSHRLIAFDLVIPVLAMNTKAIT